MVYIEKRKRKRRAFQQKKKPSPFLGEGYYYSRSKLNFLLFFIMRAKLAFAIGFLEVGLARNGFKSI